MDFDQRQLWVSFLSVEGIGRKTFQKVLAHCQRLDVSLGEVWQMRSSQKLQSFGLSEKQQFAIKDFKKTYTPASYYSHVLEKKISIITKNDDVFPKLLAPFEESPLLLFAKGNLGLLGESLPVAVVGTRHLTSYGHQVTQQIVQEVTQAPVVIVSGFMYGADTLAHQTAINCGAHTIGVLGYGFDHLYPASQQKFAAKFLAAGNLLVSEYAPHVVARAGNFPARNRIVAGLSLGVVVTEAALKSGTHITAGYAADFGRPVMAVPGPIQNPYSAGTKKLINDGATLITSGYDVIEIISQSSELIWHKQQNRLQFADQQQQEIHLLLREQAQTTDELTRRLKMEVSQLVVILSLMELAGTITRHGQLWHAQV